MNQTPAVVVGVDGGRTDESALIWAVRHAARTGRRLVAVHASEPEALAAQAVGAGAAGVEALLDSERERVDDLRRRVEELGVASGVSATLASHRGSPLRALLEHQDEAGIIVVGTGRKGAIAEWVLGSTSIGVAAHATCPVAVINPEVQVDRLTHGRIGVAVDGSADSRAGARSAVEYADRVGCAVVLVSTWFLEMVDGYVVTEPDSPEWAELVGRRTEMLEEVAREITADHPQVRVEVQVHRGPTVATIVGLAQEWDAVVAGSRGLGTFQGRLLGSVSQRLMRAAPCPVVVVTR
ncbi:universal stress protein [Ornithinimicrobium sp. Y1847]|uniref:universal stress protein n=1 Tax=unclassified Ornithinimicrobium TaxID=2615080 RepID=UPI003B67727D